MYGHVTDRLRPHFRVDWLTVVLTGLVALIQLGALSLIPHLETWLQLPETQATEMKAGAWLLGVIVVESALIVVVWRLWKYLPDWLRKAGKYLLLASVFAISGYLYYLNNEFVFFLQGCGAALAVYLTANILERYDAEWILFNLFAVGLGIGMTAVASHLLAPLVVIALLVGMIVWDHVAVNLSDVMGELVEFSASAGIPNYLVIPNRLRVDTDGIGEYIESPETMVKPDGVRAIIGLGDFALPAILTGSAWVAGSEGAAIGTFVGTVIAMVVLRNSMERTESALPALPWLNSGAIAGYTVVTLGGAVLTLLGNGVSL